MITVPTRRFHPDGNVIAEAGYFKERLVSTTIDISQATRGIANRAINDDTILKDWLNSGVRLVQVESQ